MIFGGVFSDLRKDRNPLSEGVETIIIKMCVLKSLSGALLKGVARSSSPSPSPGKISSMRRLAYLLIDLLCRRAVVCPQRRFQPPPHHEFL
jgi:hypothetical protein